MKKTENDVLRVALLTRVSSQEQVAHGYSLQAQEAALVEYANNNHMRIVGIYRDEGHSARKPILKRPVMLNLLEDVKAGKFDRILFTKLDRWFRNVSEYHATQAILDKHNVTWQAILEDYQTVTADGRLKVNIMLSVAENEADRTSERIKFTLNAKMARKECFFKVPLGYTVEKIDGVRRVVKDPETQHIMEDFFRLALATNISQASQLMNDRYNLNKSYHIWRQWAKREIYTGVYRGIEGYAPPYLTKEEFYILNNKNKTIRKVQQNRIYLFSGLINCPKCGARLTSKYSRSKRGSVKEHFFYRCNGMINHVCDSKTVSELVLEKYLLENTRKELERCVLSAEAAQNAEKKNNPKKNEIEHLQEKLRGINAAFFAGNMTDEEYVEQSKAIKEQIAQAQQKESITEKAVDTEPIKALLATDFEALYTTLTREEKRTFWRSLIDEIILDGTLPVGIKLKA